MPDNNPWADMICILIFDNLSRSCHSRILIYASWQTRVLEDSSI